MLADAEGEVAVRGASDVEPARVGEDVLVAVGALLDRLDDIPTPAGPTPRQISAPSALTFLPIIRQAPASPGQ